MKMEMELVTKQYLSLKSRNKQLKDQMAKISKHEVVGAEITSTQMEMPTSPSTELSLTSSNKIWYSWPIVPPGTIGCYEERNPCRDSAVMDPYLPPRSWLYPLVNMYLSDPSPSHPHNDQDIIENAKRMTVHCGSKSDVPSSETTYIEETSASVNIEEMPSSILKPKLALALKVEMEKPDIPVLEKPHVTYVQSHKTPIDPAAAAEARKRRKELKKLKFAHGRQFSSHS